MALHGFKIAVLRQGIVIQSKAYILLSNTFLGSYLFLKVPLKSLTIPSYTYPAANFPRLKCSGILR